MVRNSGLKDVPNVIVLLLQLYWILIAPKFKISLKKYRERW